MQNRSLFFGDNLDILRQKFPGNEGYFDLIYLDPPFNSNRNYNVLFKEGLVESEAQTHAFEDSWHWTHEAQREFDDLIKNAPESVSSLIISMEKIIGRNDIMAYLVMMTTRLLALHRVLKPTGSIYLHCDPTASHYLKIVMDSIFGKKRFRNELVWLYKGRELSHKNYNKKHDIILFYTKSDKYQFNWDKILEPLEESSKKALSRYKDEKGYFIVRYKKGGGFAPIEREGPETYRQYVPEGVPPRDWFYADYARKSEQLGYETQKPETLLKRIILASSSEGDWILDPFCGCGTTVSVSEKLKRNWVGIDISMLAVKLIERRIVKQHPQLKDQIHINGLPRDLAGARALFEQDPWDFEYWVAVHLLDAKPPAGKYIDSMKGADKGVDGVITLVAGDSNGNTEYERVIVQVKGGHVQRSQVATLKADTQSQSAIAGVFVCLEKPTGPMMQEAAQAGIVRTKMGEFPALQILTVEELLSGKRPKLPGMISPYKQALTFNPTIPQTSLL